MNRLSTEKRAQIVVHGYIARREADRYVAVFLRPNLVAEGRTAGEAQHRLGELLHAYVTEAANDDNVEHFMSLRAPVRFYAEYLVARFFHDGKIGKSRLVSLPTAYLALRAGFHVVGPDPDDEIALARWEREQQPFNQPRIQ